MSCRTLPAHAAASSYSTMPLRKILGAAHFLEPADRALELEIAVARWIKSLRLGIGGGEKLHLMLVERIDQSHEPRSFVAHLRSHHRNADDDHGVIAPRNGEIVGRPARLAAQPLEREDRDPFEAFGNVEPASTTDIDILGRDLGAVFDWIVGELEESPRQVRCRL